MSPLLHAPDRRSHFRTITYNETHRVAWDAFVAVAANSHFMHSRSYLDYHRDRFDDHSLLYFADDSLIAILPAHRCGTTLASHRGLTFGGLLTSPGMTPAAVSALFTATGRHLVAHGFTALDYRPPPVWVHRNPTELDLHFLHTLPDVKMSALPAAVMQMNGACTLNPSRRNARNRVQCAGYCFSVIDHRLTEFVTSLTALLKRRHQSAPVHSLEELVWLQAHFPEGIRCYGVTDAENTLSAGALLFVSETSVKLQYLTYEGHANGAAELLFDSLFSLPEFRGRSFDFGTADDGGEPDAGLLAYKESMGGHLRPLYRFSVDAAQLLFDPLSA